MLQVLVDHVAYRVDSVDAARLDVWIRLCLEIVIDRLNAYETCCFLVVLVGQT